MSSVIDALVNRVTRFLDAALDWISIDTLVGMLVGAGAGVWGAWGHKAPLAHEETILLTVGTADIALLAVVLAAVALMAAFLNGFFGRVIEVASSTWEFFRPFQIVAWVSALGALLSFGGAIDASHNSKDSRAVVFGVAIWLSTWAIIGSVFLVREFIKAATEQREFARRQEKARLKAEETQPKGQVTVTEESAGITVIIQQHRPELPQ